MLPASRATRLRTAVFAAVAGLLAALVAAPSRAQASYLLSLEGPPVTVRYAPGALDRADHVQRRFALLAAELGRRSWRRQLLVVELLAAEDWSRAALPPPFGLPAITAEGALALPAWGTAETVALWHRLLGGRLPSVPGTPMRGSPEEAASLAAADLAGELAASRLLLAAEGISGDRPWVDDLLASALAVSALQRHEKARWPEIRLLFESLARPLDAALAERLRGAPLVGAAERIAAETGDPPARHLLKLARKSGGRLESATLLERYPWLAAFRGGPVAEETVIIDRP